MNVITRYACSICGQEYDSADQAIACENYPLVTEAKIPRINDNVLILEGQGCGQEANILAMHIVPCIGASNRHYWHTVDLIVRFPYQGAMAQRVLLHGQYEVL